MNDSFGRKKKLWIFSLLLFLLLMNSDAGAQERKELSFPVTQFKLKNGLQVFIAEDYSLPLVAVVVAYNVGSINEQPGKTGLAYLLENLMFQGSENVSPMQHISLINRVGGRLNAATTEDKTIFYQTVPSNQLARVLWLESDRMKSLEIGALNVQHVKEALIEEIHHRRETNPYLDSLSVFDKLLYPDFAYSHPVIGVESDVRNLTLEDIKKFHSTFYRPNNAALSIVGNIDKRKAESEIRKYFETIPTGNDITPLPLPKPLEKKSVVQNFESSLAEWPGFHLGYKIASPFTDYFYPLTVVEYILLRGKTSRLYKRLIKKDRIAFNLSGGIERRKDLACLKIFVVNNNFMMVDRSQKAIFSEINRLKSSFISEKDLKKSKNMLKRDYIEQFATAENKALFFAETYLSRNRIDDPSEELGKYLEVTPSALIRAINKYLTQESIILNIKIK